MCYNEYIYTNALTAPSIHELFLFLFRKQFNSSYHPRTQGPLWGRCVNIPSGASRKEQKAGNLIPQTAIQPL